MEKLTNWCVYMHEHRKNGRRFFGATDKKPTNEWQNGEGHRASPRLYEAIKASGWDAFRHEILYTNLTRTEAERLVEVLVVKYGTRDPACGYNEAGGQE
jgi:hypothetical protein